MTEIGDMKSEGYHSALPSFCPVDGENATNVENLVLFRPFMCLADDKESEQVGCTSKA